MEDRPLSDTGSRDDPMTDESPFTYTSAPQIDDAEGHQTWLDTLPVMPPRFATRDVWPYTKEIRFGPVHSLSCAVIHTFSLFDPTALPLWHDFDVPAPTPEPDPASLPEDSA